MASVPQSPETPADAERRRRPQMPYSERPLVEVHGDVGAVREQMLELSALARERTLTQKAASNLRFLVPRIDDSGLPQPRTATTDSSTTLQRDTCTCGAVSSFKVVFTTSPAASPSSIPRSEEAPHFTCPCERSTDADLLLVKSGLFPGCSHYVAVSYCWATSSDSQSTDRATRANSALHILDASTMSSPFLRESRAPPHVLRRAVRYAASQTCGLVWVDQECINQQDRDDKENGIQSMDAVYARSQYPVAILQTRIEDQAQVDAFTRLASEQMARFARELLSGGLTDFSAGNSEDSGLPWSTEEQISMLEMLLTIVSDRWFTRSWTTQELICSNDLVFLLEYDVTLETPNGPESWSHGEARITVRQLLDAIWWAMLPHNLMIMSEMPEERKDLLLVFWKLYPFSRPIPAGGARNVCTFLSAWMLIQATDNSRIADRLAIMGNLCDYPKRVNSAEAETRGLNYSTAMITQALLNGDFEIFLHRPMLVDFRGAVACRTSRVFPGRGPWLQSLVHYPIERAGGFGAGYDSRWPPAYFAVRGLSRLGLACEGRLWKLNQGIDLADLQSSIGWQDSVHRFSIFLVDLPRNVVRHLLLFIRKLATWARLPLPFEGSRWLVRPDLRGDPNRQKRAEQVKTKQFLDDLRDKFRRAQQATNSRAVQHPLQKLRYPLEERLGNPLLDGVDLQRLAWLRDRVQWHGRVLGFSHVDENGEVSDQLSAVFDCGEVEDQTEQDEPDVEVSDDEASSNGADHNSPVYVFTPHTASLLQHPNHSVQFRATSWIVDVLDRRQLRCKELVYGLYHYGQTEPLEYTLTWD